MSAIIPKGVRHHVKVVNGPMVLGVDLQDAREEIFVRMVCDGITLGIAYVRAGFPADNHNAASALFALPRIQQRAAAILEARRTTGVVTLPEVTDMLKRVYAGAVHGEEYSAAHNAAFSLARLYGHVTDRSTVEVIRRPSRDPDAPSEQALTSWVESLPGLPAPGPASPSFGGDAGSNPSNLPAPGAPAPPLGSTEPTRIADTSADTALDQSEKAEQYQAFDGDEHAIANRMEAQGETENGAPGRAVTGIPPGRAHSGLSGGAPARRAHSGLSGGAPLSKNGSPSADEGTGYPSAEDLFG